jgi:hypothetical protein
MIERVPIFDRRPRRGSGDKRLHRPALPGEKIIRTGGPSDAMYSSPRAGDGEAAASKWLKEGDFGEMGLLSAQPRNADVIAALLPSACPLTAAPCWQAAGRPRRDQAVAARRVAETEGRRPSLICCDQAKRLPTAPFAFERDMSPTRTRWRASRLARLVADESWRRWPAGCRVLA